MHDLALRFDFTSIDPEKILLRSTVAEAAEHLKSSGSEDLYVVTCFSDRDKLLTLVEKEA